MEKEVAIDILMDILWLKMCGKPKILKESSYIF
jgi:hypothetical protein